MAYTGTPVNVTGASCKIATVEVAKNGTVDATINTNATSEELLVWGDYPNPITVTSSVIGGGTVNYIPDVATGVVKASATPVAILIVATGFYFAATCIITDASTTLGAGAAKASFTFKTSGAITLDFEAPA